MRTLIFGAGSDCERLLRNGLPGEEILGLIDNDPAKHGSIQHGHRVFGADVLVTMDYDRVRIASSETPAIHRQLRSLGVPEEKLSCPLLEKENRDRLTRLRGAHSGETAVIIGNGPNLKMEDLDRLHQHRVVTFAFNKIYLAYDRTPFRPTYFMVEDFLVAENNAAILNGLRGRPKIYRDTLLRWLEADEETVLFGMTCLDPVDGVVGFSEDPFEFFYGASVAYTAIQMAFYMGCATIYMIGLDFRFTVPSDESAKVFVSEGEQNHFLPGYRPQGERWNRPRTEVTQLAFAAAQSFAANTGRRIFNASRGGVIEVFPRIDFDTAFPPQRIEGGKS